MSASESLIYWREPFKNADLKLSISNSFDLSLPTPTEDSMHPIKWSPGPSDRVTNSARRPLDVLTIDCFTKPAPGRPGKTAADYIKQCCPWVEAKDASLFWDVKAQRRAGYKCSRQTKEAFVAAALLLADGRSQTRCKLFDEPFPSPDSPQFPAMVLEDKLLGSKEPSDKEVINVLECFMSAVPHEMLEKLAASIVRKTLHDSSRSSTTRKWTSSVLRLLVRSKKPESAANLIIDVVLGTPGETPWHRSLLHVGALRRFSNGKAEEVVQKLVNDTLQRLAAQPDESNATKMLTQLLKHVVFLGDDFVVQSLTSIFSAATNIHIRALVVTSLGSVLSSSSSQQCKQAIVDELEKHVVPVAAELDERAPMTKELWIEAEEACQPANVYDGPGLPPICSALTDVVKNAHPEIVKSQRLVDKVLRPLLKKSRENNSAWVSIFLRKHNARHLAALLPNWPVSPQLLQLLFGRFTSRMTAAEFADLSHALIFSQFPNRIYNIGLFNNQLQGNPELLKENDVKHWMQCMAGIQLLEAGISKVLLKAQFETAYIASNQRLLTPRYLQEHEERFLRRLINDYGSNMQAWHRYLDYYKPPFHDNLSDEHLTNWRERCRPVLEFAIKLVETVRTPSWQNDPARYPTVLPETFEPSLWLLTYPSLYFSSQRDECLQILCVEIRGTIEKLVSSNFQYHTEYAILLAQIKENCALQDLMPVALNLGDLNLLGSTVLGTPTKLSEQLCVEAASALLAHVVEKDRRKSETLQPARAMFESWKRFSKEEVRRKGIEFLAKLDGLDNVAGR